MVKCVSCGLDVELVKLSNGSYFYVEFFTHKKHDCNLINDCQKTLNIFYCQKDILTENKMDTTQYGESKYLTPQIIRESPQTTAEKIGIIIGDCEEEEGKFGKQLVVKVSIDKKIKFWKLSKENVVSMQQISKLSEEWLTKKVLFSLGTTKDGKDRIIGKPILD